MSATPERSTATALSVRISASVPAASPADRIASASVAARSVKVTVILSVPTELVLCRSYRPPRSRLSRSSITERSSCNAWSTCPGARPCSQLSATRALYLGPEGSGGDVFGCSGWMGTGRLGGIEGGAARQRMRSASEPLGDVPSVETVWPTASAYRSSHRRSSASEQQCGGLARCGDERVDNQRRQAGSSARARR